ncbi:MAG: hypothetical protein M3N09_06495, partial [Actinomycetota bacterium]|nr:hypothetical protein [Actinomycetota bacterium]
MPSESPRGARKDQALGVVGEERDPQETGDRPGEEEREEHVAEELDHVEPEHLHHEGLEDRIRRREETAEDQQQRDGEEYPTRHAQCRPAPPALRDLLPSNLLNHHGERACGGEGSGVDPSQHVLRDAGEPDPTPPPPERRERERDERRQNVQRRHYRRVAPRHPGGEEDSHRRQPASPSRHLQPPQRESATATPARTATHRKTFIPHGVARSSQSPSEPTTRAAPSTPSPSFVLSSIGTNPPSAQPVEPTLA